MQENTKANQNNFS